MSSSFVGTKNALTDSSNVKRKNGINTTKLQSGSKRLAAFELDSSSDELPPAVFPSKARTPSATSKQKIAAGKAKKCKTGNQKASSVADTMITEKAIKSKMKMDSMPYFLNRQHQPRTWLQQNSWTPLRDSPATMGKTLTPEQPTLRLSCHQYRHY